MKKLNKLLALALAVILTLSLCTGVFAANASMEGHTFKAYQIFKGTQAEDSTELGNIEWGTGIKSADFLSALQSDTVIGSIFTDCKTAQDVAEAIAKAEWTDDGTEARAFAAIANKYIDGTGADIGDTLDAGYYLVVDKTTPADDAENFVYNLSLLQLTQAGDFEATSKVDVPSVEKTVDDVNDSVAGTKINGKTADYDIGDDVPFTLTATLGTIADYETYKVVFHDTLSAGFTRNNDVAVMLDDEDVTSSFAIGNVGTDGKFTVSCDDVKDLGAEDGSVIVVTYTAELTGEGVVIGEGGNENKVYLEYSNNPSWDGNGTPPTGDTPEEKVVVFTYELDANKIDGATEQPLEGAGFTLYKFIPGTTENDKDTYGEGEDAVTGTWTAVGTEVKGEEMTTFTWEGVDDGYYKLVESTTPAGYNTMEDIVFEIAATHKIDENDAGKIVTLTGGEHFAAEKPADGVLEGDIENNKGSTLPETGGIGTTIFYVIGGILLVGAAILLITKKRMSSEA